MEKLLIPFQITLLFLIMGPLNASDKKETFILKFHENKVEVSSPKRIFKGMGIILENKTLVDLRGKLVTGEGDVVKYFSVRPKKFVTLSLDKHFNKRLYILPQAPAVQEIELIPGKTTYEVPSKK